MASYLVVGLTRWSMASKIDPPEASFMSIRTRHSA
jgi:hypothetical protein